MESPCVKIAKTNKIEKKLKTCVVCTLNELAILQRWFAIKSFIFEILWTFLQQCAKKRRENINIYIDLLKDKILIKINCYTPAKHLKGVVEMVLIYMRSPNKFRLTSIYVASKVLFLDKSFLILNFILIHTNRRVSSKQTYMKFICAIFDNI